MDKSVTSLHSDYMMKGHLLTHAFSNGPFRELSYTVLFLYNGLGISSQHKEKVNSDTELVT